MNYSKPSNSSNPPEIPESCGADITGTCDPLRDAPPLSSSDTRTDARRDYETALRFWNESAASGCSTDVSMLEVLGKWKEKAEASEQ